ncbi:N-6 DNA methylase [Sinomonas sp. ASV486]|uniref:N-6 DNA methylase n=1 Tax=Sinomonas sp. ASV486 TaxID=3051170 RepID=UPI0027DE128E|nr:N-6 DNA methylase [Sinomonas sp. ASV486]MDQ4489818.1 N-6 DNA methylase [Sinomonas sp. ASV486]
MSTPASKPTISASDIAVLAGVGRSTVSNWRQRHTDFPKPAGGSPSSPRFDTAAVRAWLKANGKEVGDLSADRTLWNAMDSLRGLGGPEESGELVSALLVWRYVSDPDSAGFDNTLPSETWWPYLRDASVAHDLFPRIEHGMQAYEDSHPERLPLFETFAGSQLARRLLIEAARRPELLHRVMAALSSFDAASIGTIFVAFRDRLTNSSLRGYDEFATSAVLVDLVAAVARSIPGPVHDPVAGSGRMLLAVGAQGEERTALTGQDVNLAACVQANQRALVIGRDNVTMRVGDVFETDYFERGLAQVVVMDPPYGLSYHQPERLYLNPRLPYGSPPKSRIDTAWLQIALWYLGEGGRAIVIQPAGSAFEAGSAGKIRAALLQNRTVEAIVALPGGLASHTQISLNLWVLARPGETSDPESVLLIDHSQIKDIDVDIVAGALQGWRDHRKVPSSLPSGAVSLSELIGEGANLTPKRWVSSSHGASDIDEVRTHVEALLRTTKEIKPPQKLRPDSLIKGGQEHRLVGIADLVKAASVTVLKTTDRVRESDYGVEGAPVVTGAWICRNEMESRRINLGLLEHTPVMTQPGDVLVQNTGGLAARVDSEGGRVLLSPSYQLLRVTGEVVRPEYLAEFIMTAANKSQAVGAAIQRVRLQDLKIPLLPLAEQDRVLESIAEVRRLQAAAGAVLRAAAETRDALVEAIAAGTITLA